MLHPCEDLLAATFVANWKAKRGRSFAAGEMRARPASRMQSVSLWHYDACTQTVITVLQLDRSHATQASARMQGVKMTVQHKRPFGRCCTRMKTFLQPEQLSN